MEYDYIAKYIQFALKIEMNTYQIMQNLAKKYSICYENRDEYLQIIQNVSILIFR